MISSEEFFQHLRSALNHLYDPYFLKKSPLVKEFGLGDQPDAIIAFQRILNEGISTLETQAEENSQRRKYYELIMYRYIQQFGQEEIANQLGMSVRNLRREQNAAIYDLAAILWERHNLGSRPFQVYNLDVEDFVSDLSDLSGTLAQTPTDPHSGPTYQLEPARVDDDIVRMKEEIPLASPTAFYETLDTVLGLVRPLAGRYRVDIHIEKQGLLPGVAIHQVALRQLLLNILSVMIHLGSGSQIYGYAKERQKSVEVTIRSEVMDLSQNKINEDERASVDIASRIVKLYGGQLEFSAEGRPTEVIFDLPVFEKRNVLVVDDNIDFIQLVERSLTGTRYQVTGERVPQQAVIAAETSMPDVILLDVMMPTMDGWEVLGRLRNHPKTSSIPIIVCTVLPQEELALSLGASDYLRKPVTQEAILDVLDRQMAILEQGSR